MKFKDKVLDFVEKITEQKHINAIKKGGPHWQLPHCPWSL